MCAEDEGFEMTPPLNEDEVGKEDLLLLCSDLKNDCVNDAAKVLEGMSEGNNDANKYVDGINEGMNGDDDIVTSKKIKVASRGNDISIRENDGRKVVLTDYETDSDEHVRRIDDSGVGLSPLIREQEKYMQALLRKLKGNEMGITDPFAIVKESNERSYAKALADSNKGSTVKVGVLVNLDEKTYFDRFYVCFKALKDGTETTIYLAWAMVSVENKDNWSWFLELLAKDLEVPNGNGLTLVFDQHKGLIEAVKDVMPLAEHRQCARHIYDGFRKQFSGVEFRELFWA
nr:pentatricopeptide repeat-containing protein [Tanacetum cinerariifolium]